MSNFSTPTAPTLEFWGGGIPPLTVVTLRESGWFFPTVISPSCLSQISMQAELRVGFPGHASLYRFQASNAFELAGGGGFDPHVSNPALIKN